MKKPVAWLAGALGIAGLWRLLHRRRLLVRHDRRSDIHEAFLSLACCLICWSRLENSLC